MLAATIYQANTDSDTCSGYAVIASVATCYNTSWIYYSIDECSRDAASTSATDSSSTATSSATSSSASGNVSGGAIAGAVVGSVCGLAIIGAVSAYIFWFRPKQQEKKKKEQDEIGLASGAAVGTQMTEKLEHYDDANFRSGQQRPSELQQLPPELSSATDTAELPSAVSDVAEAPGDEGGFELGPESNPVELPGDHEYRSSSSTISSDR